MKLRRKKSLRLRARWRSTNGYFKFGLLVTAIVIGLTALLAVGNVDTGNGLYQPRWWVFLTASPNEIGDTIAGIAGTLAFLWIIVTVMIQGRELQLQRRELVMTRSELRAQREASQEIAIAQKAQVRALDAQIAIFEDERLERTERRAERKLDSQLADLLSFIEIERDFSKPLMFRRDGLPPVGFSFFFRANEERLPGTNLDEKIRAASMNTMFTFKELEEKVRLKAEIYQLSESRGYYLELLYKLSAICEMFVSVGDDQKVRMESLGVKGIFSRVERLVNLPLWRNEP